MRCQRCQGYMVRDQFMDILNVSGELDFKGWRCLNCGDIVDPVIVHHHLSVASTPVRPRRRWWSQIRAREGYTQGRSKSMPQEAQSVVSK